MQISAIAPIVAMQRMHLFSAEMQSENYQEFF